MAWVRIDDHFDEHPKMQRVGPLAWGYWLAGLAYCNRNLTDGFIPWNKARTLCSFEVVEDDGMIWELSRVSGHAGEDMTPEWLIGLLIDAGLWEECKNDKGRIDGYRVHDYPDYQPLKSQIEEERAKKVAAGQAGGKASAQARAQADAQAQGQAPAQAKSKQSSTPNPNPIPNPVGEESPTPPPRARVTPIYSEQFEQFWPEYPKGHGSKKATYAQWRKLNPDAELFDAIMVGLAAWKRSDRWKRDFVVASERWVRDRLWENPPVEVSATGTEDGSAFFDGTQWRRADGLAY